MCSSGSINNAARLSLVLVAVFLASGCGRHAVPAVAPAPLRGHADLNVLVRRHPGWAGVLQYDQTLARLTEAATQPAPTLPLDVGLGTLPPVDAGITLTPALALEAERRRLSGIAQAQIVRLGAQLARNRSKQLAQERESWVKAAQKDYAQTVVLAQADYAQRVTDLTDERHARRVNLVLQIRALDKIVKAWDVSIPPTPELNKAKADLARKLAELAAFDASQDRALVEARAARDETLAQARKTREASVETQALSKEAALNHKDELQMAKFGADLSLQQLRLLRQAQSLKAVPVSPAGSLTAQSLPPDTGGHLGAAETKLRVARSRLVAQRARWIAFLYDDTRAAALDVAGQRHWIVSFGPGQPQGADLTAPLAQALTASVWKG